MRIAIVNDTITIAESLRRVVVESGQHKVAWIAHDGADAVANCQRDIPDLVLMDIVMPSMDGVEATRRIMAQTPCAILVVTETLETRPAKVFECLGAGALDAVQLFPVGIEAKPGSTPLLAKIQALSRLIQNTNGNAVPARPVSCASPTASGSAGGGPCDRLVVIGASAGGPDAVATLLEKLPTDFPAGIIVVQHIDSKFVDSLASWLQQRSALPLRLARHGDTPECGVVLLADSSNHLCFTRQATLAYTREPEDSYYRPSIDVLFKSTARYWKKEAVGILLTGMGRDGAQGLKSLLDAGFTTIAQNAASSVVYGMPKAAAALGAASEVLPLRQIAPRLEALFATEKVMQKAAR